MQIADRFLLSMYNVSIGCAFWFGQAELVGASKVQEVMGFPAGLNSYVWSPVIILETCTCTLQEAHFCALH